MCPEYSINRQRYSIIARQAPDKIRTGAQLRQPAIRRGAPAGPPKAGGGTVGRLTVFGIANSILRNGDGLAAGDPRGAEFASDKIERTGRRGPMPRLTRTRQRRTAPPALPLPRLSRAGFPPGPLHPPGRSPCSLGRGGNVLAGERPAFTQQVSLHCVQPFGRSSITHRERHVARCGRAAVSSR